MTHAASLCSLCWSRAAPYLAAVLGGGALAWLATGGHERLAIAAVIALGIAASAVRHPRVALVTLLVYLSLIGDIRRVLIPLIGWQSQDPLLLVAPAAAGILTLSLVAQGRVRLDTGLSKAIALLMGIMLLQVMNPLQGGLGVGIGGILFYVVPLLWYWLGRAYVAPQMLEWILTRVVVPLAFAAAAMGLYQTYVGHLPYQERWIEMAGYAALWVGTRARAFAFFPSSAEYAHYLSFGIGVCWIMALQRRSPLWIIGLAFLAFAVFLIGARGPVVKTLFTLTVVWAVMGKNLSTWLPRLVLAVIIGVIATGWSLTEVASREFEDPQISALVDRQTEGLLNPADEEKSTAGLHNKMFVNGIIRGISNPFGLGLGATTMAAGKFGGVGASSEVDLSDMFLSLGLLGGLTYGLVIALVLFHAFKTWHRSRQTVSLMILGVLFLTAGQWLRGAEYSVVAIVWLCIGVLDRWSADLDTYPETGGK